MFLDTWLSLDRASACGVLGHRFKSDRARLPSCFSNLLKFTSFLYNILFQNDVMSREDFDNSSILVKDIMTKIIISVNTETTVFQVAKMGCRQKASNFPRQPILRFGVIGNGGLIQIPSILTRFSTKMEMGGSLCLCLIQEITAFGRLLGM